VAVTVKVLDCPLEIVGGLATMLTVGVTVVGVTVTVVEAVAVLFLPLAVAV